MTLKELKEELDKLSIHNNVDNYEIILSEAVKEGQPKIKFIVSHKEEFILVQYSYE